jgi:hypothetical protein
MGCRPVACEIQTSVGKCCIAAAPVLSQLSCLTHTPHTHTHTHHTHTHTTHTTHTHTHTHPHTHKHQTHQVTHTVVTLESKRT